ncbi:MAG: RNA pseudouridine synthase [Verrucomicrobiota bacterium]
MKSPIPNPPAAASRADSDVLDFSVIDESPDWIVVNKPAPLQIHPSKPGGPPTLWHGLRALLVYDLANGAALSIINRLDRETSGLVLIAKNAAAARSFNKSMMRREVRKEYTALVHGWPERDEWTVDAPLLRRGDVEESPVYLMQAVHPDGAPSVTRFRVLRRWENSGPGPARFALVAAVPETGRMHQIRVHLQHSGHSVVGDKLYGPGPQWYLRQIEHGWTPEAAAVLLLPRHALHSTRFGLPLPDGTDHEWESPPPPGWNGFCPAKAP